MRIVLLFIQHSSTSQIKTKWALLFIQRLMDETRVDGINKHFLWHSTLLKWSVKKKLARLRSAPDFMNIFTKKRKRCLPIKIQSCVSTYWIYTLSKQKTGSRISFEKRNFLRGKIKKKRKIWNPAGIWIFYEVSWLESNSSLITPLPRSVNDIFVSKIGKFSFFFTPQIRIFIRPHKYFIGIRPFYVLFIHRISPKNLEKWVPKPLSRHISEKKGVGMLFLAKRKEKETETATA